MDKNAQLKADIKDWQERADDIFENEAKAVDLVQEARTLLLRASESL